MIALVVTIIVLIILATVSINVVFGEGGLIKRAELAKQIYEDDVKKEEEKMKGLEQSIKENIKEPEVITENIKGAFIKYDVEYMDTLEEYEYTSTNGWRLENYDLAEDGKTLSNVRLISTGVPARMNYIYDDETNNYYKWVTDNTKIEEFKNSVLGSGYTVYTGEKKYCSLQASAGFYYNLGQMTFIQGTEYTIGNQGYYTKIKNGNKTYSSGETLGDNLFKARNDAKIRMLTLPELNRALGETDIDRCEYEISDEKGLYQLENISTGTMLNNNKYTTGWYWLASPYSEENNYSSVCLVRYYGLVSRGSGGHGLGVRPLITLDSKVQLVKKTDSTGFVYYEMVNVN